MLHRLNLFSVLLGAAVIVGVEGASNILLKPVMAATFALDETGYTGVALSDLNYAIGVLDQQINSPVPITIQATFGPLPADAPKDAIGGAMPTSFTTEVKGALPNTEYPIALAHAINSTPSAPGKPDITLTLNSQANWYYGIDPIDPMQLNQQSDFISTVLHEVSHGLGFAGTADYKDGIGSLGVGSTEIDYLGGDANTPDIYDRFVVNGLNQSITSFPNKSEALGDQLVSNNLFFNGPNAIAANGGNEPKLYAPTTWKDGSSYSHLDQDTYDTPGNPNADLIPADPRVAYPIRQIGPITLGILEDEGWSVNQNTTPVPEPMSPVLDTLTFSILGIGYMLNKQRKQKKSGKFI